VGSRLNYFVKSDQRIALHHKPGVKNQFRSLLKSASVSKKRRILMDIAWY